MKLSPGQLKALEIMGKETGTLLPHTVNHLHWWDERKPASIQSFHSLKAKGLCQEKNMWWTLTEAGRQEYNFRFKENYGEPRTKPCYVSGLLQSFSEVKNRMTAMMATCGHEFGPGVVYAIKVTGSGRRSPTQTVCPACWIAWKKQGGGRCPRATDLTANFLDRIERTTPEPKVLQGTTEAAPEMPVEPSKWNPPPPPPPGPPTYAVALTEKEIEFITHAMIHSANIHVTFANQGSEDYPPEDAQKYANEVKRLCKVLEAAG